MKIAVCGFGLIGRERVKAIQELRMMGQDIESLAIYDPYIDDKKRFSERESDIWLSSLEALVKYRPDWIVVSTPHDSAVALIERVLPLGCRVLMEKPFGRSVAEASRLVQMSLFPEQIWIGFNYRFYPGIARVYFRCQHCR